MKVHDHVVHFDESRNTLSIFRRFENSSQVLFTERGLDGFTARQAKKSFNDLAKMLGENILLDSPVARRLFGL